MTELIAHEIQVTTVHGASRKQTYHLVQRHAAYDIAGLVSFLEMPVHVGVHHSEDECFVSDKCLIVALGVGDSLFVLTAIGHLPKECAGLPVLVAHVFCTLDPIVRDVHSHAIVEAVAAILEWQCQARHAAHLLGNGDGIAIQLVNQLVGQCQVGDSVIIFVSVIVVGIISERLAESVAVIQH